MQAIERKSKVPATRKHHARPLLWMSLVVFAVALVYGRVCGYDFVAYDDPIHIYENPHLNPLTASGIASLWLHPYENLYIPVAYMAFAALCAVARVDHPERFTQTQAPFNPHVFHFAGLVVFTLNALLVFILLRRVFRSDRAAAAGALVFALHPLAVESAAWISELRGLLSISLALGAVIAYMAARDPASGEARPSRRRQALYVAATACFALSMLCKPSSAAFVLIAPILDGMEHGADLRRSLRNMAPWAAVAVVLFAITRSEQFIPAAARVPIALRFAVAWDAIAFYLSKLIAPVKLAVDYGRTPAFVIGRAAARIDWLAPAAAAIVAWTVRRRCPRIAPSLAIGLCALLPNLGLAPFAYQAYSTVADRYAYPALLCPAMLTAAFAARAKAPGQLAALALVLVALGAMSWGRTGAWRDTITLMRQELTVNPRSYAALNALGSYYAGRGDALRAEGFYRRAIRERPDEAAAYVNLGSALFDENRPVNALSAYNAAIAIEPSLRKVHEDKGIALERLGNLWGAVAEFDVEIRNYRTASAYIDKGAVLIELKMPVAAIDCLRTGLAIGPASSTGYTNLAIAQGMARQTADALASVARALALSPNDPTAIAVRNTLEHQGQN